MRVAVHFSAGHALSPDEDAVVAYKLGRVEDGVHNAPVGHEPVPLDSFLAGLLQQAQAEYPDAKIVLERLVDNGDETGRWIPASEFDPEQHTPVGAGTTSERSVSASLSGGVE